MGKRSPMRKNNLAFGILLYSQLAFWVVHGECANVCGSLGEIIRVNSTHSHCGTNNGLFVSSWDIGA